MGTQPRRIAVIGSGVAGLSAAHTLATSAQAAAGDLQVVLIEADERLGGKLQTSPFAGHPAIDEGPDAFLARLPWGTALAKAVGLGDELVAPTAGKAAVWWDGLHPIPEGLLLGMPTDVLALARSKLLTWGGKLRAATEPFRPRTSLAEDSLGGYVRARFGDQVHLRLVDPLVGSIYAADTDHFSLAAVPQIYDLASKARSILIAGRSMPKPAPNAGPVFYAPRGGMGSLVQATADAARAHGAEVRTGTAVAAIEPGAGGTGWLVDGEPFDAIVLACPAAATARLLAQVAPEAAATIGQVPAADVAMVSIALHARDWPRHMVGMSGYLVPKPMQRLVTAASFGSQKWTHWQVDELVILRISLGRDGLPVLHLDDEQLLAAAVEEVGHHIGVAMQPVHTRVSRWNGAFPQYRPHHAQRIAEAEGRLPAGLALAGASYHGMGVPACIRSGKEAAGRLTAMLFTMAQ
ncbi:MAG: protoporphyrinogen oxidase [Actinomycetota bacterium]|nr:protoporphyrinogen oxidase [Actinomycetota bacterium]